MSQGPYKFHSQNGFMMMKWHGKARKPRYFMVKTIGFTDFPLKKSSIDSYRSWLQTTASQRASTSGGTGRGGGAVRAAVRGFAGCGERCVTTGEKMVEVGDTLWLCQNSYWIWPFIVDLPIDSMVIFHSFLLTFTRGYRAVLYDVNIMTTSKGVVLAK